MKRLVAFLAFFLFFCGISFNISSSPVHADVGWMPGAGGVLTSDSQNDKISMDSEKVTVQIKQNESLFFKSKYEKIYEGYYVHVEASFVMKNNSDDNITEQVFFPFYTNSSMDGDLNEATWLKNISILVNEQSKEYSLSNLKFNNEALASAVFQISSEKKSQTIIEVIYDLQLNNRAHSEWIGFDYMMNTGATWAGTIGSGEVTIDLSPIEVKYRDSVRINDFFFVEDSKLVWRFNNLEPDDSYNIKLSFDSDIINAWDTFPSYINSIGTGYPNDKLPNAMPLNTNPDRQGWPEDYTNVKSSSGYLFDESQDNHGWYYSNSTQSQKAAPSKYLQFNFDSQYTISDLKIQTGIKVNNGTEDIYNVIQRPKTIRITFSDNTYQDVQLEDTPSIFQTIKLNPVKTTSISLSFTDYYPAINEYIGIGRLSFEGMQKVIPESTTSSSTSSANTKNLEIKDLLIYFSIAAVGILGIVIIVSLVRRSKKNIVTEIEKPNDTEEDIKQ